MKVSDVSISMFEKLLRESVFPEYSAVANTEEGEQVHIYSSEYLPVATSRYPLSFKVTARSVSHGDLLKKVTPESITSVLGTFRESLTDAEECVFQITKYSTHIEEESGAFRLWCEVNLSNLNSEIVNRSW